MTSLDPSLAAAIDARSRGRMESLAWALSPDEQRAVVLLRIRETGYLLESLYEHRETEWSEITTSNGTRAYGDGAYRLYGEAPRDATRAVATWRDATYDVPIQNGHFAFAIWDLTDGEYETLGDPAVRFTGIDGAPVGGRS